MYIAECFTLAQQMNRNTKQFNMISDSIYWPDSLLNKSIHDF